MKEIKVSHRYAKALFQLAVELNKDEKVFEDAKLIATVCEQNREFLLMLRSPVIKEKIKISVISEIFKNKIDDITLKFLKIITKNRREGLIPEIAGQVISVYKDYKNIVSATITSASELDNESREKILNLLKKHTHAEIELSEKVEEELIGGFILSFKDKQYDASLRRQIQNLHKEFDENLYEKGF
ncbi:MAG: ATP synthase F1 subunit delta [Bacteroidales bacterium]|nr:ATP synthase F1 subunit delta [Bacteroidales bacterium]